MSAWAVFSKSGLWVLSRHNLDVIALKETAFILWLSLMNLLAAMPTCDEWCGMQALGGNNECHSYCSRVWQWVYSSSRPRKCNSIHCEWREFNGVHETITIHDGSKASSSTPLMAVFYYMYSSNERCWTWSKWVESLHGQHSRTVLVIFASQSKFVSVDCMHKGCFWLLLGQLTFI